MLWLRQAAIVNNSIKDFTNNTFLISIVLEHLVFDSVSLFSSPWWVLYWTKSKQNFPCNMFGGESFSAGIGQYLEASYIPIQESSSMLFQLNVRKWQLFVTFFLHSKTNVLMKIVGVMKKLFWVCAFKNGVTRICLNTLGNVRFVEEDWVL